MEVPTEISQTAIIVVEGVEEGDEGSDDGGGVEPDTAMAIKEETEISAIDGNEELIVTPTNAESRQSITLLPSKKNKAKQVKQKQKNKTKNTLTERDKKSGALKTVRKKKIESSKKKLRGDETDKAPRVYLQRQTTTSSKSITKKINVTQEKGKELVGGLQKKSKKSFKLISKKEKQTKVTSEVSLRASQKESTISIKFSSKEEKDTQESDSTIYSKESLMTTQKNEGLKKMVGKASRELKIESGPSLMSTSKKRKHQKAKFEFPRSGFQSASRSSLAFTSKKRKRKKTTGEDLISRSQSEFIEKKKLKSVTVMESKESLIKQKKEIGKQVGGQGSPLSVRKSTGSNRSWKKNEKGTRGSMRRSLRKSQTLRRLSASLTRRISPTLKIYKQRKKPEVEPQTILHQRDLNFSESDESLQSSSSMALLDKKDDYVDTIEIKKIFLNKFEELPSLSEIRSSDSEEEEEMGESIGSGKFMYEVDSFTEASHMDLKLLEASELLLSAEEMEADEGDSISTLTSFPTTETIEFPSQANVEEVINNEMIEQLEMLKVNMNRNNSIDTEQPDMKEKTAITIATDLMNRIIEKVVAHAESDEVRLPRLLDKHKLMRDLLHAFASYRFEKNRCIFLNKRVTEFFYRKRCYYPITPTNLEKTYEKRFFTALSDLDHALEVAKVTEEMRVRNTTVLSKKESQLRKVADEQIVEMEDLIRSTVCVRDDFVRMKTVTEDILKKMARIRNELEETRLKLILKQHTEAELKLKVEKLENLGNGLTTSSYLAMQEEVKVLAKKIEERNAELKRLFININTELHMLAHLKSKRTIMDKSYDMAKVIWEQRVVMKNQIRKQIFKGNVSINKTRQEMHELRSLGSLITFPTLLQDYDRTNEKLIKQREVVEALRVEHDLLIWRIDSLENRLWRRNGHLAKSTNMASKLQSRLISKNVSRLVTRHGFLRNSNFIMKPLFNIRHNATILKKF